MISIEKQQHTPGLPLQNRLSHSASISETIETFGERATAANGKKRSLNTKPQIAQFWVFYTF
jgi:hypothetical protein